MILNKNDKIKLSVDDASGNVIHISGGGGGKVKVDATLTQEGMAADAKATGDRIDYYLAETSKAILDTATWCDRLHKMIEEDYKKADASLAASIAAIKVPDVSSFVTKKYVDEAIAAIEMPELPDSEGGKF